MNEATAQALALGTRQLFERHFGPGIQVQIVRPLVLPEERSVEVPLEPSGLDEVRQMLENCERCLLCQHRKHIVFGSGDPNAHLVVIGEAPGEHEDQIGEPFVGRAGEMLDDMLGWLLDVPAKEARAMVYVLNVIKCRPPHNRDPRPDEVEACLPFLRMQLAALRPRVILLMGAVALRALFCVDHGISRQRGTWMEYEGVPVMPTFHPAYLLRKPQDKRLTFSDLQELKRKLAVSY